MEFLQAKTKGIPIYVFILKNVLNAIDIWRNNKSANFNTVVTSSRVFEFVDLIYKEHQGWVYEFETANDIISTLKNQFAYLFNDSLQTRMLLSRASLSKRLQQLDAKSLKIVTEKPTLWEYRLFGSALKSGLENAAHYRDDYSYNLYIGSCKMIEDPSELLDWIRRKFQELSRLADCYGTLFNKALPTALGPSGVAGDAEQLVYIADSAVRIYKSIIDWSLEFDSILLEDGHQDEWIYLRNLSKPILVAIEQYAERYNKTIADVVALSPTRTDDSEPLRIDLTWQFPRIDTNAVSQVFQKLVGLN